MKELLHKINDVKHIVIVIKTLKDIDTLGSASAIYTYLLTLHKKVSFVCENEILENNLLFIPWSDKLRTIIPSTAEFKIYVGFNNCNENSFSIYLEKNNEFYSKMMFDFFIDNNIKINQKMATALYAGILYKTDGFLNEKADGIIFALIGKLLDLKADKQISNKKIMNYISLANFRLNASLYSKMQLLGNAQVALFILEKELLDASGALYNGCQKVLREALSLPTVKIAIILLEEDDNILNFDCMLDDSLDKNIYFKLQKSTITNIEEAKKLVLELINKEI